VRQFILISKALRLFVFNIWNWIFGAIFALSWIVDDFLKWESDYSGGDNGVMFTVVVSSVAFLYSIIVDWINYAKVSTIYSKFDNEKFGVQYFLEAGFRETVSEYMKDGIKTVYMTRFEDALSRYVTKKLEKFKAAERSVWGN
jgi:hypothetical protein